MNSLKMSVFAIGIFLSAGVIAGAANAGGTNTGGTMDSGTGAERDLNRPSSNDTNRVQDCSIRNGNDKLLCEKELQNDAARARPNDNSRINRNNDGNMIDDRKALDAQSRESEINNSQPLGSSAGDVPLNSNPSPTGTDNSGTGSSNAL